MNNKPFFTNGDMETHYLFIPQEVKTKISKINKKTKKGEQIKMLILT